MTSDEAPTVFYALPELHYPRRLNAVKILLEGAVAQGWGERTIYLHNRRAVTYEELRHEVHLTAAALRSLGIAAGDRVLLRLRQPQIKQNLRPAHLDQKRNPKALRRLKLQARPLRSNQCHRPWSNMRHRPWSNMRHRHHPQLRPRPVPAPSMGGLPEL